MEILDSLGINFGILFAQIVNFLIVLYLLKRFAYGPFLRIMSERKNIIGSGIKKAEDAERKIQQIKIQREKILGNANEKASQILKQIEETGKGKAEEIINESQIEKEKILIMAKEQGKMEIEKMQKIQKEGMFSASLKLTEKILRAKIDAEKDRQIIEEFLSNISPVKKSGANKT